MEWAVIEMLIEAGFYCVLDAVDVLYKSKTDEAKVQ